MPDNEMEEEKRKKERKLSFIAAILVTILGLLAVLGLWSMHKREEKKPQ